VQSPCDGPPTSSSLIWSLLYMVKDKVWTFHICLILFNLLLSVLCYIKNLLSSTFPVTHFLSFFLSFFGLMIGFIIIRKMLVVILDQCISLGLLEKCIPAPWVQQTYTWRADAHLPTVFCVFQTAHSMTACVTCELWRPLRERNFSSWKNKEWMWVFRLGSYYKVDRNR
jgi:hypothetical protein